MQILAIRTVAPARHIHVAAGKVRKRRQCGTELSRTARCCPTCGQPPSLSGWVAAYSNG